MEELVDKLMAMRDVICSGKDKLELLLEYENSQFGEVAEVIIDQEVH